MTPSDRGRNTRGSSRDVTLVVSALVILAASVALTVVSDEFVYGRAHETRPIIEVVAILLVAGGAYATAVRCVTKSPSTRLAAFAVGAFGFVLSSVQLMAAPVQESDYYRYLVDGGVVACGQNPYRLSPAERLGDARRHEACLGDDPRWREALERVDYPELRTIYPPLAELWLGAVVSVAGPSLTALRVSYLAIFLALLVAVAGLLCRSGRSPLLIAAVGWAPLVFKEAFNSAHYDLLPALLLAMGGYLLVTRRPLAAAAFLGLTAATKLFAFAIVPIWLRATPAGSRIPAAAVFALAAVAPWLPFAGAGTSLFEGTTAFGTHWTANSPLFGPFASLLVASGASPAVTRAGLGALLGAAVVGVQLGWRMPEGEAKAVAGLLGARAALAMLLVAGPTSNPWYFCWLLPLIALDPGLPWLALVAMLPLYYVQFWLIYQGMAELAHWVAIVEFAPFVALVAYQAYRNRSSWAGRMRSDARA